MKILIGYDGSASANAAIDDLRRAGLSERDNEALVLSVADVWPQLPSSAFDPDDAAAPAATRVSPIARRAHELARQALAEAKTIAADGKRRVLEVFPEWRVEDAYSGGSPGGAIVTRAEEWQADLIVIGSHGRSKLERALLGSVSHDVMLHAHCSVRVARHSPHPAGDPVRLVVGIDGSTSAATAVSAVAARAWPAGSVAHVVTALDVRISMALGFASPQPMAPFPPVTLQPNDVAWAREALEAVARELRDAGLAVTTLHREGDPRELLVTEAQAQEADCIFVGAKGMSRVERFLLGSVSRAVAARATCSVEIVRFPLS